MSVRLLNQNAEVLNKAASLHMNINPSKGLQDVLKTNLGPKGTIKKVVGGAGDIKLTKDGNTLLKEMGDFFYILHDLIGKMEEITDLHPIPDAYVLVMKFKFNGISIGLLYASVSCLVVPQDLGISDVSMLYNVDEATIRSLNGCRVADQILKLVPDVEYFRTTLRCIKH